MLNSTNMAGFLTKSLSQIIGSSYYSKTPSQSPYILGTSPPDSTMELYILDNRLQVCSCPCEKISLLCHSIIKMALLPESSPSFFSLTQTDEEYTLILTEEDYKTLPEDANLVSSGQVWRVLTVSVGALGSFNEIMGVSKIAKSAIGPLADQNISVLCLSTYQSDYILVPESQLDEAVKCLSARFKIFNEDHKRINDSKGVEAPLSPEQKKSRPIIHPYKSPEKIFHVAGLDGSKLSSVVQVLLELMFFPKKDDDFSFFHFTIVHGDISLVLDDESFHKFPKNALYSSQSAKDGNWRIISIGEDSLGFVECGIVAQVVEPLATTQVSSYYLSTFNIEYCMVHERDYKKVRETFEKLSQESLATDDSPDGKIIDFTDGDCIETELENTGRPGEEDNAPRPGELDHALRPGENDNSRPGENMSLSESLDNIENSEVPFHLKGSSYSRSPLTPTSECSSYGTSPLSDVDILASTASTTDPIPIPATCLRDP